MQIELSDSRTANEEARADSHAAPATRGSEVRRQVSIAVPFFDLQGSNHHPRAQSTRYPLSLHPPHENSRGKGSVVNTTLFFAHNFSPSAYFLDIWVSMESWRPYLTTNEGTKFIPSNRTFFLLIL